MYNKMLIPIGAAGTKIAKAAKKVIKKVSTETTPIEDTAKSLKELDVVKAKKPTPYKPPGPDSGVIKASNSLINYVEKLGNKTNDDRIKILGEALKTQELPKEFVAYVDAIFKQSSKVLHSNSKSVVVRKYLEAPEEIVEFKGKEIRRPTFQKWGKEKETIHDEEKYGRDSLKFYKKRRKTDEELKELDSKLNDAVKYLDDIEKETFKPTKSMVQEIYSKSRGSAIRYSDIAPNTELIRKHFARIELPKVAMNQSKKGYVGPTSPEPHLDRFYQASDENVKWWQQVMEQAEAWRKANPGIQGEVNIRPITITPKTRRLFIPSNNSEGVVTFPIREPNIRKLKYTGRIVEGGGLLEGSYVEPHRYFHKIESVQKPDDALSSYPYKYLPFVGQHYTTKRTNPFTVGYRVYVGDKPVPGMPKFPFEEHHNLELALMDAEAYIRNPKPKSDHEHLMDYLRVKREHETKGIKFIDNFLALLKKEHVGKEGIHSFNPFNPQDLTRIKELSRTGVFNSIEDLLNFYKDIKGSQKLLFENLLKARDSLHRNGGKLDSVKQFKQGGLIDNLNKPETWEEYQKQNRLKK